MNDMVRPLRIEYPGALYHVTVRGNARQNIYHDDHDKRRFLKILEDIITTHNLRCYAYCLMTNHFHLLLETPDANLSIAMRDLNGIATQQHHKKYASTGHVFQGRYRAFLIEKETYLFSVARYVVLNPVRAHLVQHPQQWIWSSYRATIGNIQAPAWLDTKILLSHFSKNIVRARRLYKEFVMEGVDAQSPFTEVNEGSILGSAQFITSIWDQVGDNNSNKDISRADRMIGRPTLKEIFSSITTMRQRNHAIRVAKISCGYLNTEIAKFLKLDHSTIGKICRNK